MQALTQRHAPTSSGMPRLLILCCLYCHAYGLPSIAHRAAARTVTEQSCASMLRFVPTPSWIPSKLRHLSKFLH
ncbi:hypothetical protein V1519DRAFT_453407 [Lipomyces tetrasporus]